MCIENIEKRFLEIAELEGDLSVYPLTQATHLQVKTNKEKSKEFSEVFTPLWLVDKMLDQTEGWLDDKKTTLDLCSGYGQFTVRMIRKKQKCYSEIGQEFDLKKFLTKTHHFNELQLISCFKLVYIFGANINLYIGDSRKLPLLDSKDKGIFFFSETLDKWIDVKAKFLEDYKKVFIQKTKDISLVNFETEVQVSTTSDFF